MTVQKEHNSLTGFDGRAHAEFSASASDRWLNCPGSHELIKTCPPLPESKYAQEGTDAHACLEFMLKNASNPSAAFKMASKRWPKEMVDHAHDAVNWVQGRAKAMHAPTLLVEKRVDSSLFTAWGNFGTVDIALVEDFGRLVVIDYKYGAGHAVDPRWPDGSLNSQLVYYALGLSYEYDHNFSEVELVVIQPRAYHETGETVRSTVVSMPELLSWKEIFRNGVMETSDPDPKTAYKSGRWCKFCPAAIKCPELTQANFKRAQIVFSDEKGIEKLPDPALTNEIPNLGRMLDACSKLEAWIDRVREHAQHVLEQGGTVPGWKLVQKRGQRKWKDVDAVEDEVFAALGEDGFKRQVLSPAQIEKLIGRAGWIDKHTETVSSGNTIAPQTDKRPEVKSDAAKVFGALPPGKKPKK